MPAVSGMEWEPLRSDAHMGGWDAVHHLLPLAEDAC